MSQVSDHQNQRFEREIDERPEVGDRIASELVGTVPAMLGYPRNRSDGPPTQALAVTAISRYDDLRNAILWIPDYAVFVRASSLSRGSAMSQRERDWTIREVGDRVVSTGGEVDQRPDEETDQPEDEYVSEWVEVLFDEIRRGHTDSYDDELEMVGSNTLKLYDGCGTRKAYATVELP